MVWVRVKAPNGHGLAPRIPQSAPCPQQQASLIQQKQPSARTGPTPASGQQSETFCWPDSLSCKTATVRGKGCRGKSEHQ